VPDNGEDLELERGESGVHPLCPPGGPGVFPERGRPGGQSGRGWPERSSAVTRPWAAGRGDAAVLLELFGVT